MKRINFTGRKRITKRRVQFRVRDVDEDPHLDVLKLDLDNLGLPEKSPVFVEAYRRSKYDRIHAGTVQELDLPTGYPLLAFESIEEPLFRVKVIGTGDDSGKLLAVADQLRPAKEDEGPQQSLLSIACARLGQRLWKLDVADDDPQLLVNVDVGDWKEFAATPMFRSLVLPEAFRQVVDWVLEDLDEMPDDDATTPRALWVSFLADMDCDPREIDASDSDERDIYIENVMTRFCQDHRFLDTVDREIEWEEQ